MYVATRASRASGPGRLAPRALGAWVQRKEARLAAVSLQLHISSVKYLVQKTTELTRSLPVPALRAH